MAEKNNSFLSAAIIGAPIAGTTAYAGYKFAKSRPFTGVSAVAENPIAIAARQAGITAVPDLPIQGHLDYIRGLSTSLTQERVPSGEIPKLVQGAWDQAIRFADPITAKKLASVTQKMRSAGADIEGSLQKALHVHGQSFGVQKVLRHFQSNVAASTKHFGIAGQVPVLTPFQKRRWSGTLLGTEALPLGTEALPSEIRTVYDNIANELGKTGTVMEYTRPDFPGHKVLKFNWAQEGASLMLPLTSEGVFLEGKTLRTKYISPAMAIWDPEARSLSTMTRHEFVMREFAEQIVPAMKSGRLRGMDLQQAISSLRTEWLHKLETMPNLPANIYDPVLASYQKTRGGAVQVVMKRSVAPQLGKFVYKPGHEPAVGEELLEAMRVGGLQPGTSPVDIAKGIVMGPEVQMRRWQPTPGAADVSRRVEQSLREWGLTPEAAEAAKKYAWSEKFIPGEHRAAFYSRHLPTGMEREAHWTKEAMPPHLRTAYISEKKYAMQMERMGIGDGAVLASKNVTAALGQQSTASIHLATANMEALKQLQEGNKLTPGTFLGMTTKGVPYNVPDPLKEEILGVTPFWDKGKGEFATLSVRRRHEMTAFEKFFGDLRAGFHFVPQGAIESGLATIPEWKDEAIERGIRIVADMDTLKKNRGLHNKQMMTALENFLSKQMNLTPAQEMFWKRPVHTMRLFERAAGEGPLRHVNLITQLMAMTRSAEPSPAEFGKIFGAVPEALEGKEYETLLRRTRLPSTLVTGMETGIPIGMAQPFYGRTKELLGSGKLASIEPRAYEMLAGGGFGQLGEELAKDLLLTGAQTNPQRLAIHQSLMQSLRSFQTGEVPTGLSSFDVKGIGYRRAGFKAWMEGLGPEGGALRLGGEFKDIWVPSVTHLEGMRPYKTAGGKIVASELTNIYASLAQKGAGMYTDVVGTSPVAMRNEINTAISKLVKHAAPAGKGIGRLLGGKGDKLLATRFLMAGKPGEALGASLLRESNVIGISEEIAKQLIEEGRELYGTQKGFETMAEELLQGKPVGGLGWRHPIVHPHSFQPARLQVIPGLHEPVALVSSIPVNARIQGLSDKAIKLGLMVNMAGDYDADQVAVKLVSPDLEQKIFKQTQQTADEYTTRWVQNQVRTQIFKPKGQGGMTILNIEEKMLADVAKLGTVQEFVPRLSTEITAARQAVLQHLKGQELANAQQLLYTLEQEPIAAKHLRAEQVLSGGFREQLGDLAQSLRNRDIEQGIAPIESLFQRAPHAQKMLQGDLVLENYKEIEKALGGVKVGRTIPGMELGETWGNVVRSLKQADISGASEAAKLLRGQATVTKQRLPSFFKAVEGSMSKSSVAYNTMRNILGGFGESIIKHHKAIGFGFAGSLAIATALSSPPSSIGPGSGLKANIKMNNKKSNLTPDDIIHAPEHSLGQPTAPPMLHQNSARIMRPSVQVDVRTAGNYAMNTSDFSERIRRMTSGRSSVNLNIRRAPGNLNNYKGNEILK